MNAKKWWLRLLTAVCVTAGVFSLSACDQLLGQASAPKVLYKISADGTYAEVTGSEGVLKEVVVQKEYEGLSVRVIQDNAFANCDTLTKVTLPSTIQAIGNKAFYDCDLLTKITLPEGVQHIGEDAFGDCASLAFKEYRNAKFLGTVANEYYALIEMTNKTQEGYKIDDGTKVIANGAFDDCIALTTLDFPKSVTSIGANAFADCHINAVYYHGTAAQWTALKSASASFTGLSGAKVYYYSVTQPTATGNYWHYEGDTPTPWPAVVSCVHNWKTVTTVAPTCIAPGQDKKSCTLCGKTEYIYKAIDSNAHSWGTVTTVAPTCTAQGYDKKTCTLCNTTHKSNYTAINNNAHSWGTVTTVAPTCIAQGYDTKTCWRCSTTQKSNYTAINPDAHGSRIDGVCSLCKTFVGTEGVAYTKYGTYATVTGYTGTATEVVIADTYQGVPVTGIGDNAFAYCSNLAEIVIPNSITSIGAAAFVRCTALTNIVIPKGVKMILQSAFGNCKGLTSIIIPDGVTEIDCWAFHGCNNLTIYCEEASQSSSWDSSWNSSNRPVYWYSESEPALNTDCTAYNGNYWHYDENGEIVVWKWMGTAGLVYELSADGTYATVTGYTGTAIEVIIAPTYQGVPVTKIADWVFHNYSILTSVVIPENITSIGNYAFAYCKSLTSIETPESVTSIGGHTFYNCDSLTSIKIGATVTSIGNYAFACCSSLENIEIPDSVTSIGSGAFGGCDNLTIYCEAESQLSSWNLSWNNSNRPVYWYSESEPALNADETAYNGNYWHYGENGEIVVWEWKGTAGLVYQLSADGTYAMVTGYTGTATEVVIPSTYQGVPVTTIGGSAFSGCDSLTEVVIPDSITSIGVTAFGFCDSLTEIIIPDSVTSIGNFAFTGCSSLTIHCEVESKPSSWVSDWNPDNRPVVWGYTGE